VRVGKSAIELIAKTPCAGVLPIEIGTVSLTEVVPDHMTIVAPYAGKDKELSAALKGAHGMAMPAANRATGKGVNRAIWFGQGQILLSGPAPDAGLARHGSVVDQSDGWAVVALKGAGSRDVLARLTPIDLRASVFKNGHTARTDLMHMMASITCLGGDEFRIMVFRGFARTLVHDLETAMQGVAARALA